MNLMQPSPAGSAMLDRIGAFAGTACAIHCVVFGLAPAVLAVGAPEVGGPWLEWGLRVVAVVMASWAGWVGFRTHRDPRIAGLMVGSVLVLVLATLFESLGVWAVAVSVLAGLSLAVAHIANLRATRRCCQTELPAT